MALRHGDSISGTNITAVNHGSVSVNVVYHGSTKVFEKTVVESGNLSWYDDEWDYDYLAITIKNTTNYPITGHYLTDLHIFGTDEYTLSDRDTKISVYLDPSSIYVIQPNSTFTLHVDCLGSYELGEVNYMYFTIRFKSYNSGTWREEFFDY